MGEKRLHHNATHGKSDTPTYYCWIDMRRRCLNENHSKYPSYGGRGITICQKWLSFEGFLEDMGEKPHGLTLDRIDNDKGYFLENCRWATRKQQARNRRKSKEPITWRGKTQYLSDWADELGFNWALLWNRLHIYGWSVDKAFTQPVRGQK